MPSSLRGCQLRQAPFLYISEGANLYQSSSQQQWVLPRATTYTSTPKSSGRQCAASLTIALAPHLHALVICGVTVRKCLVCTCNMADVG